MTYYYRPAQPSWGFSGAEFYKAPQPSWGFSQGGKDYGSGIGFIPSSAASALGAMADENATTGTFDQVLSFLNTVGDTAAKGYQTYAQVQLQKDAISSGNVPVIQALNPAPSLVQPQQQQSSSMLPWVIGGAVVLGIGAFLLLRK